MFPKQGIHACPKEEGEDGTCPKKTSQTFYSKAGKNGVGWSIEACIVHGLSSVSAFKSPVRRKQGRLCGDPQ